jgi:hypothetical protein
MPNHAFTWVTAHQRAKSLAIRKSSPRDAPILPILKLNLKKSASLYPNRTVRKYKKCIDEERSAEEMERDKFDSASFGISPDSYRILTHLPPPRRLSEPQTYGPAILRSAFFPRFRKIAWKYNLPGPHTSLYTPPVAFESIRFHPFSYVPKVFDLCSWLNLVLETQT